jgi:hypothetical protein
MPSATVQAFHSTPMASASKLKIHDGTMGWNLHGLSTGSLGQNQGLFANVSNIWFDNINVISAVYAARF